MDLTKKLPEAIQMTWEDEYWMQTLDYEQIPFWCRRCHEYGHLFRDCPKNNPNINPKNDELQTEEGFTRAPSRKQGNQKQDSQEVHKKIVVSNKFEALEGHEEENQEKMLTTNQGILPQEGSPASASLKEEENEEDKGHEGAHLT